MGDINALAEIDLVQWLLVGFILIFGITKAIEAIIKFFNYIGKPIKWIKTKNTDHDLIMANTQTIKDLAELHKKDNEISNEHDEMIREELHQFMDEVRHDIRTFTDNRVHDREQSREIQKEWSDKIDTVFDKLDKMQKQTDERFTQSEAKTNKRVQSDIKERIAQSYRRYNVSKKITHMELEALEDLIDTYENFGGENSFVHSVVQKEMYTWEVAE